MTAAKPIKLTKENFAQFGKYYNLYEERMTTDAVIFRPMRLGITKCKNGSSFRVDTMERHNTSEELIFTGNKPIVLSIASSDSQGCPGAGDVVSFLMRPGDLVVIKKGIWHDACHAVEGDAFYYFLAYGSGEGDEVAWYPVQGEEVQVKL
jgi:ureidoglycolate lyase